MLKLSFSDAWVGKMMTLLSWVGGLRQGKGWSTHQLCLAILAWARYGMLEIVKGSIINIDP